MATAVIDRESLRQRWLEERLRGIGGSDAPVILGLSPWKSPLQLYVEKVGAVLPNKEETEAMEWGHRLEDPIDQKYQDETGRLTENPGNFTIQYNPGLADFLQATLDRRIIGYQQAGPGVEIVPAPHDGPGNLEIKTANYMKADEWTEEPPLMYQVQLQHQLAVTGAKWGSLAVLIGGQMFRWADVERNDAFIEKLLAAEEEFWRRVIDRDPPAPDGSDSAKDALHALYPAQKLDTCELPIDLIEWDKRLEAAKVALKGWEEEKTQAENMIKAALGEYTFGFLPNGVRYAWKVEPRREHTVAASSPRVLRRSEPKAKKGK